MAIVTGPLVSLLDHSFGGFMGNIKHTGKVPKRTGGKVRIKKEIEDLRRKLQDRIAPGSL